VFTIQGLERDWFDQC